MIELSNKDAYRLMLKEYPDVLNIEQMCEVLGISKKTGYKLLQSNTITSMKVGRTYRIPKIHLIAYLRASGEAG
ncbi:MAG: helix-turn-helix domain-containing protein [Oscillospiraceae bacterium]|nr:helix-turn-helix domain-containing protein [Oscillospiraceae bacterium]